LARIDDVLLELNKTVAVYTRNVAPIQYNNETYRLIDNYIEVPYTECSVCGDYPIFEVSVFESDKGKTLRIDNKCTDSMTGQNVSQWFRDFRKKRQNIIANRKYIEQLSLMLEAHNRSSSALQITDSDVKQLSIILEQLYEGLNLTTAQQQIADRYVQSKVQLENFPKVQEA
jgi:hypothetical protein